MSTTGLACCCQSPCLLFHFSLLVTVISPKKFGTFPLLHPMHKKGFPVSTVCYVGSLKLTSAVVHHSGWWSLLAALIQSSIYILLLCLVCPSLFLPSLPD